MDIKIDMKSKLSKLTHFHSSATVAPSNYVAFEAQIPLFPFVKCHCSVVAVIIDFHIVFRNFWKIHFLKLNIMQPWQSTDKNSNFGTFLTLENENPDIDRH